MNENPLQQYFRTPSIHLDLPSKGEGYAPGTLDLPVTGEVPVLPMTAIDEITYKTPDALFNGSAVVQVIESCVPSIKDAWKMPVTDLTAVLTAIRIASFGHEMDIETTCPKCGETANYGLDLRTVLDLVETTDYSVPFNAGDLSIMFKPMTYKDLNTNEKLRFEEERVTRLLTNSDLDQDDQIKMLSESFKKISNYTLATIAKNVASITTPDVTVADEAFILEFLQKADSSLYNKIKNAVIEQKAKEALKPLKIKCNAVHGTEAVDGVETGGEVCGHEYEQPFTLDMSSFFARS